MILEKLDILKEGSSGMKLELSEMAMMHFSYEYGAS